LVHSTETLFVLFLAFLIDILIGDPEYRWHPIRIIGRGILFFLGVLKKMGLRERWAGVFLAFGMILMSLLAYASIHFTLLAIHPLICLLFNVFLCYSFLALKDLFAHIIPVIEALKSNNIIGARRLIGMVVGRDVDSLDSSGIVRAAIETMAENFVDGFFSPVFWYLTGCLVARIMKIDCVFTGVSFMLVFKIASTLDSMVGYKNEEFIKIGWAGARLDDIMNFLPSRFCLGVLFVAAMIRRLHFMDGIRVAFRDRLKHDSPNSAHSESFVAGALNIRLGGPTRYHDAVKDKPWLGCEYSDPDIKHIPLTIKLLMVSSWFTLIIAGSILVLSTFLGRFFMTTP
jgi:adenosylcobinamide-phosphate synthase